MIEAMKAALKELEDVLECINQDKIPFDGDDFHETLRTLRQAIEQAEKQEPVAWMTNSEQDVTAEFLFSHVQTPMHKIPLYEAPPKRPVKSYTGGVPQYATETPDDLLRQSEREGWRWARECEAEVVRVTDLNQRLMAGAQELRDATDAAEFDEAWNKLFALFKEAI
jgi:hypothetical protein